MKPGKAKTHALARKLADLSMEDGVPSSARVDAVLAFLGRRPLSERRAILGAYLRIMRREEALRTLTIERAGPLSEMSKGALVSGMAHGRSLNVVERENAALIGGLKVRLGDDVYDASLKGVLERLATR